MLVLYRISFVFHSMIYDTCKCKCNRVVMVWGMIWSSLVQVYFILLLLLCMSMHVCGTFIGWLMVWYGTVSVQKNQHHNIAHKPGECRYSRGGQVRRGRIIVSGGRHLMCAPYHTQALIFELYRRVEVIWFGISYNILFCSILFYRTFTSF